MFSHTKTKKQSQQAQSCGNGTSAEHVRAHQRQKKYSTRGSTRGFNAVSKSCLRLGAAVLDRALRGWALPVRRIAALGGIVGQRCLQLTVRCKSRSNVTVLGAVSQFPSVSPAVTGHRLYLSRAVSEGTGC